MKKIFSFLTVLASLSVLVSAVTSCEKDDNGNEEDNNPAAVLFTPKDNSSGISLLEFTENSQYIIVRSNNVKSPVEHDIIVLEGTYTKSGKDYKLDGFGTVTVEPDNDRDGQVSVTIAETGKTSMTFNAAMKTAPGNASDKTVKLCRSWKVVKIVDTEYDNKTGEVLYTETVDPWVDDYGVEFPQGVTFTRNGTFLTKYSDDIIVDSWAWSNESKGVIDYKASDTGESTQFTISFDGTSAVLTGSFEGWDDSTVVEEIFLTEIK